MASEELKALPPRDAFLLCVGTLPYVMDGACICAMTLQSQKDGKPRLGTFRPDQLKRIRELKKEHPAILAEAKDIALSAYRLEKISSEGYALYEGDCTPVWVHKALSWPCDFVVPEE